MRREREKENESETVSNKVQTLIEAFARFKTFITSPYYLHSSTQEYVYSVIVQLYSRISLSVGITTASFLPLVNYFHRACKNVTSENFIFLSDR